MTTSESAWLAFTDGEYYNRIFSILVKNGVGEGDAENLLANTFESGFQHGHDAGIEFSGKHPIE
jgi:hypothetical protein